MNSLLQIISSIRSDTPPLDIKRKLSSLPPLSGSSSYQLKQTAIQQSLNHIQPYSSPSFNIKQFNYSNHLDYKKSLINYYLKQLNISHYISSKQQQQQNIKSLKHLQTFLLIKQQLDPKNISKHIQDVYKMQKQYISLKTILKNQTLLDQIQIIFYKAKQSSNQNLQGLVDKRQAINKFIISIKLIQNCIEKIKNPQIYKYWMYKSFYDIIKFDTVKKVLNLNSLEEEYSSTEKSIVTFKIQTICLEFKKNLNDNSQNKMNKTENKIREINRFLEKMEKTFQNIRRFQKRIKMGVEKVKEQAREKECYIKILEYIKQNEEDYKRRIAEEIFPVVYILTLIGHPDRALELDLGLWKKICRQFQIEKMQDINSTPSLLLSYRHSQQSSLLEQQIVSKFEEIPRRIAMNLINGKDEQFEQVCFFLEMNTRVGNGKGIQTGADLSLNLVTLLINQCMDKIQYEKIEKLLKIKRNIRLFKVNPA